MHKDCQRKLKKWFLSQARDFPWRENPTPYAVWVSEVMLQQTQAAVVIPYFERWMQRFPNIDSLAMASIETVLKEWEGLGYYSRARNLHEGARYIVENFEGRIPDSPKQLKQIKGIGSYTVGAIMSFAFHQRHAAVDGNVLRVLARYYCIEEDICKSKTLQGIHSAAQNLLPEKEPWVISEALIELGATICSRKPKCSECPLKESCKAYMQGRAERLPVKSSGTNTVQLYRAVAIIYSHGHVLVGRGAKGKVMADLYEFPYFELGQAEIEMDAFQKYLREDLGLEAKWRMKLMEVKHSFTRYRAHLSPHIFSVCSRNNVSGYDWMALDALKSLPFSSGHRRILNEALQIFIDDGV